MKNNQTLITIAAVAVVALGIGFFGGVTYQTNKANAAAGQFMRGQNGSQTNGGRFGARSGMRPTAGEIVSSDDKSITVKMSDGSTKIVLLTDKTQINKAEKATKIDLKTGIQVAVFGSENSDGSITAQNVQLNPQLGAMGERKEPNQAAKSPDAIEIVVKGSNYKFDPSTITVKKGQKTRILFKDMQGMHDFRVDELKIATAIIQTGTEDFVEFTPDKTGTFEYFCSVGSHRQMGMKGTLVVK